MSFNPKISSEKSVRYAPYTIRSEKNQKKELSTTEEDINQNWQNLIMITRNKLYNQQLKCLPYSKETHRFQDILCPADTAVYLDEEKKTYLHANYVAKGIDRKIIATQAPLSTTYADFWKTITKEKIDVIVDLTTWGDRYKGVTEYGPYEEKSNKYGETEVTLKDKVWADIANLYTYSIGDNLTVQRLHFAAWPDEGAISVDDLESLVTYIENNFKTSNLLVHCRAGLGRTGTLIAALIINEMIKSEKITKENYLKEIDEIILTLREQRGRGAITDVSQYELLVKYTENLLNNKK